VLFTTSRRFAYRASCKPARDPAAHDVVQTPLVDGRDGRRSPRYRALCIAERPGFRHGW
jgi:hypothetical protein